MELATEVASVANLFSLEAQPFEEVAQSLHLLAVGGAPTAVEHSLERLVEVTVGEQVVGQLREDRVGVLDEGLLGPVPLTVEEPPGHPRPR